MSPTPRRRWASSISSSLRSTATICRTAAQAVRQGDRGDPPSNAHDDDRDPDPRFPQQARAAVETIGAARPDVYNHNLETVPRLYPTIRPGARYYASLRLLETVKRLDPSIFTKSGIMLGLGEQRLEVHQVMDDMRSADIDFLTMGQYLQPTPRHAKVERVRHARRRSGSYGAIARAKGFLLVAVVAADAVELSRRRRFREDARCARGASWPRPPQPPDAQAQRDARVCPTRRSRCSTWSPMSAAIANSCPGSSAVRVRSNSDTQMVADLIVGFKATARELHLARREAAARAYPGRLSRRAAQAPPQRLEVPVRRQGRLPGRFLRSTSRSRTGCSRCWRGRCSIARSGR